MKWKLIILIFLELCFLFEDSVTEDPSSCTRLQSCAACAQNPACAWCSQKTFMSPDKKQLPRCNPIEAYEQPGYRCNGHFRHNNLLRRIREENLDNGNVKIKSIPISPQQLSIKIRMNDPINSDMSYKEVEDYPLDLYYLMDGTYTMKDDKDVLVSFGDSIGERLRSLTSKFRQGFGTFVDKVTSPYVSTIPALLENPCILAKDTCVKPYGFKNHMKLSNDTRRFTDAVRSFVLSASTDAPEGGFDALMQVMVCENQIGWSEQARRVIIFATDAPFHYAGDGRFGGVLLPNDGNCHMDAEGKYYTHSLINDYPSMSQINSKAKKHSTNIIFAVTSPTVNDYKQLAGVVEGSKTTELAANSSNIVDLVEAEYKRMKSIVELRDTFPSEFFKVTYYSKCNGLQERERNTCEGLQTGAEVRFRVEIELIKCYSEEADLKQKHRIYAVGVPDGLEIDVEMLCSCPCEKNGTRNSPHCNKVGSEVCGLCDCENEFFGSNCECSASDQQRERKDESRACMHDNSTEICSGRGTCICEQCHCLENQRYSGAYCECDSESCIRKNGVICNNKGKCNCGKCECEPNWEGDGCECYKGTDRCIEGGSDEVCSGHGKCECGQCQCFGKYNGDYCENCNHESCPNECDRLKHCVQCKVHKTGSLYPSQCDSKCSEHVINIVDVITVVSKMEFTCKHEDPSDGCTYIFSYKLNKAKRFVIKAQKTKECPPEPPLFRIIIGVALIVVIIGIIIFALCKIFQFFRDKREYVAYKKEQQAVTWGQETNPIYNNPIGNFQNPLYAGKD